MPFLFVSQNEMTINRTSEIIARIASCIEREENPCAKMMVKDFLSIVAKYQRMEEALHNALLNCVDDGSDPQSPHYTIVCEAVDDLEEALSFDPLSQ